MRGITAITMCLAVMFFAWPAAATDYYDPPWDETLPNTTSQAWEVVDIYGQTHPPEGGPYTLPEEIPAGSTFYASDFRNEYGEPSVTLEPNDVTSGGSWEWDEVTGPDGTTEIITWHYDGPEGTLGKVTVTINNNKDENRYKLLFYQVEADGSITPTGDGPFTDPPGSIQPLPDGYQSARQLGNGWYGYTGLMQIVPNPEKETFTFYVTPCTNISEIVIDTICAPEPASMGLLLFGAAGLLIRRRRG